MIRLDELELILRDNLLYQINIKMNNLYDSNDYQQNIIMLYFANAERKFILELINPDKFDNFDDHLESQYITHIKCFKDDSKIIISLDPYDERDEKITEEDNFIIQFEDYRIIE
jgi:hypothetical protein